MRFALCAADRHRGVLEAFIRAGWTPVKLFSTPTDERTDFNRALVGRAIGLGLPIQLSPLTRDDYDDLARRKCDALVVAGYDWRLPDWRAHLKYALNFHPSPLPEGRGPYPVVRALLEQRPTWGVTCHQVEREFDAGAVIACTTFPLAADESHESIDLKVQVAIDRLAGTVARDLDRLWADATPQGGGASYWKRWTDAERTLDFTQPVADVLRRVRAFGLLETMATIEGNRIHVRRAVGWVEAHDARPGSVVHVGVPRSLVVAAADGYVGLAEWSTVAAAQMHLVGR